MGQLWPKSLQGRIRNLSLALVATVGSLWGQSGTVKEVFTFPDIPLRVFQNSFLPGTVSDDHNINFGGMGSGLWHDPSDGPGIFWMVTDRGPNGQIRVGTQNRRTFPVPEFTPFILKVKAENGTLTLLEAIPITGLGPAVSGVTGISNASRDEAPFDCSATTPLAFNPHGLDREDLVRTNDGTFWLVEEYSPSIVKVDATGKVLKRFLPAGLTPPTVTTGYVSVEVLPSIFGAKRKRNRGFEGAALSPNQKTLWVVLQSPLSNPNATIGDASRNTRILEFDLQSETVVAEFVYRFQPVTEFGDTNPAEMKVSGLTALDEHGLLVLERTDKVAKLFRVDLRKATNILGTKWDGVATSPSLEALNEIQLADEGVGVLPKDLVIDLSTLPGVPEKIEGVVHLNDGKTIAISNDNDFGIGSFAISASSCTLVDSGVKSQLLIIETDKPLKSH